MFSPEPNIGTGSRVLGITYEVLVMEKFEKYKKCKQSSKECLR